MTKEARIYNKEKTVFSIKGAGKTGQLHAKEWNWTIFLISYRKINTKWIKDLNVGPETIKICEENTGSNFCDISHSNIFLEMSPQAREIKTKISYWECIRIKSFCTAKETVNKTGNPRNERRYLQMTSQIKGWYPRSIKNSNSTPQKNK